MYRWWEIVYSATSAIWWFFARDRKFARDWKSSANWRSSAKRRDIARAADAIFPALRTAYRFFFFFLFGRRQFRICELLDYFSCTCAGKITLALVQEKSHTGPEMAYSCAKIRKTQSSGGRPQHRVFQKSRQNNMPRRRRRNKLSLTLVPEITVPNVPRKFNNEMGFGAVLLAVSSCSCTLFSDLRE